MSQSSRYAVSAVEKPRLADQDSIGFLGRWRACLHSPLGEYHGSSRKLKILVWQIAHLLHRLAIFAAALCYITRSLDATIATVQMMEQTLGVLPVAFPPFSFDLITKYTGAGPVRESTLLRELVGGATHRNDTLYLSFMGPPSSATPCQMSRIGSTVYGNEFLREVFTTLVADTAFNLTFLHSHELIMPVVDCSFFLIMVGDNAVLRAYYLLRSISDANDVRMMVFSFYIQDYEIPEQKQRGPAGVGIISLLTDFSSVHFEHYYVFAKGYPFEELSFVPCVYEGVNSDQRWMLKSITSNPTLQLSKRIVASGRMGAYVGSVTQQSNVKNRYLPIPRTPNEALSEWAFKGGSILHDNWSWIHGVHLFFAVDTLFNLLVLFSIMLRNMKAGKIWVGDAFTSISNSLAYRGPLIVICWWLNKFYVLFEYFLYTMAGFGGAQSLSIDLRPIHADLMAVYLSLAAMIGILLRERIDPALAILAYEIGFQQRDALLQKFTGTMEFLGSAARDDFMLGPKSPNTSVSGASPMSVWTIHEAVLNTKCLVLSIMPIFLSIGILVVYALLRKLYRHFHPEKIRIIKVTSYSDNKEALLAQKGSYTMFEIATGATLQVRYGVVSNYENYLLVKGIKYASADGIYSSGYVIANGRFLIACEDLMAIILIKLLRIRFKNVYLHELHDRTVQQTAKLVYPETLTWMDLLTLNIDVLM